MSWRTLLKPSTISVLVALALLGSTVAAVLYVHQLQTFTSAIVGENVISLEAAQECEFALRDARRILHQYAATGDEKLLESLPSVLDNIEHCYAEARQSAFTSVERGYLDAVAQGYEEFVQQVAALGSLDSSLRPDGALEIADDTLSRGAIDPCHAFMLHNLRAIERAVANHRRMSRQLQLVLIIAGLVVPLAGVFLGYLISRGVARQLARSREELLRSEQLAAVGQLAAGVAHELRNPLTSIKMMVQTAGDDEPADLAVIEDEVERMERTIQSFLDFARPPEPHRSQFDLRSCVNDACRLVEGRARRQHQSIEIEQGEAPVMVSADRHQLHQVLVNLMLNAMESAGTRGRLRVAISEEPDDGVIQLRVSDDGPGIPPDLFARIFDPFVSSKPTGTGLGLCISKQIIESHGGRIEAGNRPEGGAEFTVTLRTIGCANHVHTLGR